MAASNRRDVRTYQTPGVVDGNLARDLSRHELEQQLERSGQLDFDKQYREQQVTVADELSRRRQENRATVRQAQGVPLTAVLASTALAVMAMLIVVSHVRLNEISGDIVSMKQEIELLETEQVSLQTQYEQAFDPATVKEAAEAAGMHQPGEGQIYYIDLPGEDRAVSCVQKEDDGLHQFLTSISQHFYAVLEYFS